MKELVNMLENKILVAKDEALDEMAASNAPYGTVLNVYINVDSLMEEFIGILNLDLTVEEIKAYEVATDVVFGDLINAVVAKYEKFNQPEAAEKYEITIDKTYFTDIGGKETEETFDDYISEYSFITDSFATDDDYIYTDFTSDKDIVLVTYMDSEGNTVKFILNYNIYTVKVNLNDGNEPYTVPKYGYVKIG